MDPELMLLDLKQTCRFCLKEISDEEQVKLGNIVKKQFEKITNFQLILSDSYPKISCKKCCIDIKKSAQIRARLLENQKRLRDFVKNCQEIQIKQEMNYELRQEEQQEEEFKAEYILEENLLQQNLDLNVPENLDRVTIEFLEDKESLIEKDNHTETEKINLVRDEFQAGTSSSAHQKKVKKGGKERVICEDCGDYFTKSSLKNHRIRKHSQELPKFVCDLCSKKFFRKGELKDHMTIHSGIKELHCPLCDKMYGTRNALNMHINKFHLHKWQVYCEFCGKHFSNRGNYVGHIRSNHTGEKPFVCEECDKAFYNNGDLKKHKLHVHSNQAETCEICFKIFRSIISLRRHKKIHVAVRERKFECTFEHCDKKFLTNALLQQHQKVHLGKKDYQCLLCGIEYYKNAELKRHIRSIHMKIKLKCEIGGCKSQFARKETYRNHILSHHKSIGETNVQLMLKKIRDLQLPEPELNLCMD